MPYQFTQTGAEIQDILDLARNDIAAEYDPTASYVAGNYCTYEDSMYKCTGSTTGAWDGTKWSAVTAAGEIASLNATLTNSKFENVKIVSVSTNKTTVTINGFTSSGYAYGNILLFSASSIYYIWFGAATPQINRVHGTATAPTGTWDSTTLTYTITFSGSTQITVFAMGGIGRFGTITIS